MYAAAVKRKRTDGGPGQVTIGAAAACAAATTTNNNNNNNTPRSRSISLPGATFHGGSSPHGTSSMVVLSPTSHTRPANTDARSAPTSPARMPFPEGAQAQEHPRALYIPDDPYPRMYVAGSPKPMVMYPRGSTVSQVRFKPSKPQ